ncbi:MAG: hypothetical protein ABSH28_09095 [Acidobacteriota bacterium]
MAEKEADALILASPERKRILRDLLNRADSWSAADRVLYREMIEGEFRSTLRTTTIDDKIELKIETDHFINLVCAGVSADQAHERAVKVAYEVIHGPQRTEGQKERERRRAYREAVTSYRGAAAVTHTRWNECITACIVCGKSLPGGPLWRGGKRADAAYCGSACRQRAYRRRISLEK